MTKENEVKEYLLSECDPKVIEYVEALQKRLEEKECLLNVNRQLTEQAKEESQNLQKCLEEMEKEIYSLNTSLKVRDDALNNAQDKLNKAIEAIKTSINGLEYSVFNLVSGEIRKKFEEKEKKYRCIESTCSERTLLIELRNLKDFLKEVEK